MNISRKFLDAIVPHRQQVKTYIGYKYDFELNWWVQSPVCVSVPLKLKNFENV
eukprot:GAHX01003569.1.p1 GENE.GAHX01003569.1~~GAHX01003569.1.p1  ORF type:complete len:53 (+),score=2.28 GAHX01003569.1:66-224(+)